MAVLIAPSLLSANFANLGADIAMINQSDAGWLHLDIMDGVFVPNISFGFPVIKAVAALSKKPLDLHLMIVEPEHYINRFAEAGAHVISIHYEACRHLHRAIQQIKAAGVKAGVVLNPHTPVSMLHDIITDVDLVLLMSVNPGFGGQKFIEHTYAKISELKNLILHSQSEAKIEIDGGVCIENAPKLITAGADVLVAGNSVFSAKDPVKAIKELAGR
ncbi:MAG: ribulose-phosphate 3-epimerase [Bacteroidota bacterium]